MTVVIPTLQESGNANRLVERLVGMARDAEHLVVDVVIVDDSDDDTVVALTGARDRAGLDDAFLRIVHRPAAARRGGLSGAVIEGMRRATGRWIVVMDADLQHPPELIPEMTAEGTLHAADLVIASRYRDGRAAQSLTPTRQIASGLAALGAQAVMSARLAQISDPMSGFFAVRRDSLHLGRLRPRGFKILLEIVGRHPELAIAEIAFEFGPREAGRSKASAAQIARFGRQLVDLRLAGACRRPTTYDYDVHGLYSLRSEQPLPELEKFGVPQLSGPPSLTVEVGGLLDVGAGETVDLTSTHPIVSFRERTGFALDVESRPGEIVVRVSPFVAKSPHVLYTNVVEPILRWKFVELGYALVHAACFADRGAAFLITARTDTGKTTTMLKVLERTTLDFLSDDLTLLAPDGRVLTYPKPLTISRHTVHALRDTDLSRLERAALTVQSRLHSRDGRRFAFLLTKYRLPVASINAIVQRLVPPPKFHVERLVKGVRLGHGAWARGLLIIQRDGTGEMPLDTKEALDLLVENCDDAYGFPPYSTLERMLHALSCDDLRTKERNVITAALGSLPAVLIRSETLDWAERIPRITASWSADATSPSLAR